MRALSLAVVALVAAGCGRSGDGLGIGSSNEGIESNPVGANGCVAPSSPGWTRAMEDAATTSGVTGDWCSFDGASFSADRAVVCLNNHLFVQTDTFGGDQSICDATQNNPGTAVANLTADGCMDSCLGSGGERVTCPVLPERAPSRTIPAAWQLNAQSDCETLKWACPEVGDPCSGSLFCAVWWNPGLPPDSQSFSTLTVGMWCAGGHLKIVTGQ